MPKQLKVLVNENYNKDAPFTVNFTAPIIVSPGNKIALDKFTAVINNISSGFTLPDTSFEFYYALDSAGPPKSATVVLLGATYSNITVLLNAITALCNNTFTAYLASGYPTNPRITQRDIGLKILCSSTTNATTATVNSFQMQYATADLLPLTMNWPGMTSGVDGYYPSTGGGAFSFGQSDDTISFLKGGGGLVQFSFGMPTPLQASTNQSTWYIGLLDTAQNLHGLAQNSLGQVFLVNGSERIQVDINNFPVQDDDYFYGCDIYQVNGNFALRYYRTDRATSIETDVYNSNDLNPGALGSIDYTVTYVFGGAGISQDNVGQVPAISDDIQMTNDIPMDYANTLPVINRTVAFDMTLSGSLRAGLDVPSGLVPLTPLNSPTGSYVSQSSINMAIVNSSFDIAIEILDLPLQTYQASTNRKPGERNNVISYFHPEFSQVGTSNYIYDSKSYQWLDIDISYPLNLSSMTFRVYDPETGVGLDASSMSFNLLIGNTEY